MLRLSHKILPIFIGILALQASCNLVYKTAVTKAPTLSTDLKNISDSLVAISSDNERLVRKDFNGMEHVLVLTWKANDSIYKLYLDSAYFDTGSRDTWVTVVPYLHDKMNALKFSNQNLRLEQLLGLPPNSGYKHFVEIWVKPEDLFRPCADSEIDDYACDLSFPSDADSTHINWFNETIGYNKDYPWTRLGYTYDWKKTKNGVKNGLSEFIIRKNSNVVINAIYETKNYLEAPIRYD